MKSKQEFFKNRIEHFEEGDFVGQSNYIDVKIVEQIMDEHAKEVIGHIVQLLPTLKEMEDRLKSITGYQYSLSEFPVWLRKHIEKAVIENLNSSPCDTPILKEKI